MSGTSLDGIDTVVVRLEGTGRNLHIDQLAFVTSPYESALRNLLIRNSDPSTSSVRDLSQLNVRLAHAYADTIRQATRAAGITLEDLDLVGSHGQTVFHVPQLEMCAGLAVHSTLQIGDPSVLANLIGVPVIGDFRLGDMSHDGQGAPLVPYLDYVYFSDTDETRGLLNIGGISNITVLPCGIESPDGVYAFDTGPGNMVVDALTDRFFGKSFDEGGENAKMGNIMTALLAELLKNPYFSMTPPKSTGRERFGSAFVDDILERCRVSVAYVAPQDLLATASMLTVQSIYRAYIQFIKPQNILDVLIVSGGGVHNCFIMEHLSDLFAPIPVRTVEHYGLNADAKEALCFAVLAHETVNGVPTNLPSVTGASKATLLGKISIP